MVCCVVWCYVVLCCVVLCCIVLYCVVLCCIVLCCIVLCCVELYCIVLYTCDQYDYDVRSHMVCTIVAQYSHTQSSMANSLIILSILLPTTMAGLVDMFKPLLDTLDNINIQKPNKAPLPLPRSQYRRQPAALTLNGTPLYDCRMV